MKYFDHFKSRELDLSQEQRKRLGDILNLEADIEEFQSWNMDKFQLQKQLTDLTGNLPPEKLEKELIKLSE